MSVGTELVLCGCGRLVPRDSSCLLCVSERWMKPGGGDGAPRDVRTSGGSSAPSSGLPADARRVH